MKLLIIGGKGFIGSHVAEAAHSAGHEVVCASRRAAEGEVACDFLRDTEPSVWRERIAPFDAVINTVGILRASADAHHRTHAQTPAAIAAACAEMKKPFLHVSMLGLEGAADTPYFQSKRAGEAVIRAVNAGAIIVRPSLVFGVESAPAKLMLLQAALPLLVAPKRAGAIAPIHVDDLAALIVCLAGTVRALGCDVDAVGSEEMSMDDFIAALRERSGHAGAYVIHAPNALLRTGLRVTAALGMKTIVPEALDLLEHPHTGDARMFVRWLRHAPRPVTDFLPQRAAPKKLRGFASH
jgi:uncharacterized protein YbjT (DUF2867 family)